jgi:hypothetical protein
VIKVGKLVCLAISGIAIGISGIVIGFFVRPLIEQLIEEHKEEQAKKPVDAEVVI